MMSNGDEVKKRPLEDHASLNGELNGDAQTSLDVAHIPEEGSLKRLKAEDDDHVPFSPPIIAPVPSSAASDYPSLVPSLEHSRPDFPIPPAHSTADQLIDSDIKVPSHLPSTHTPSVSSTPLEPLPTPSSAAPVPLTQEPRKPEDAEVSKPIPQPAQPIADPVAPSVSTSNPEPTPVKSETPTTTFAAPPIPPALDTTTIAPPVATATPATPATPVTPVTPATPATPVNPALNGARKSSMTREQLKYCTAIIKQLKRHRDAGAFLQPVDPVALRIPDYPTVVKNPMDLSTVERKLNNLEYDTVDDFVQDVNLIFANCYLYNGRESPIAIFASNLESAFTSSLRYMPKENIKATPETHKDSAKKASPAKAKKEVVKKEDVKSQAPAAVPQPDFVPSAFTLSRAASEERRPKRDIHAPSKEIPTAIAVKKKGTAKWKADPQLRYCQAILREFAKKVHAEFMFPFMEPVDYVALNIPDYPKVIKNPMDLGTVKTKLEEDEYENAAQFEADVRLILWNCFKFNPPGTPVHLMGRRMETLFNTKWAERPPPPTPPPVVEEPKQEESESEDDSSDDKIAEMERHLKTLSEKIRLMKAATKKKEKVEKKAPVKAAPQDKPVKPKTAAKTPAKAPPKPAPAKAPAPEKKKAPPKRSRPVYSSSSGSSSSSEEDVPMITFEQKKELSDSINNFEGDKLANVVQIIHSRMPHLRDNGGQEEIELDMDSLDPKTLYKLYEYVKKTTAPKRKKPAPKKVKVQYSEADATKKITELERTLQKFEQPAPHVKGSQAGANDGYSSSSSGSSSSGSDSDSGSSSD